MSGIVHIYARLIQKGIKKSKDENCFPLSCFPWIVERICTYTCIIVYEHKQSYDALMHLFLSKRIWSVPVYRTEKCSKVENYPGIDWNSFANISIFYVFLKSFLSYSYVIFLLLFYLGFYLDKIKYFSE